MPRCVAHSAVRAIVSSRSRSKCCAATASIPRSKAVRIGVPCDRVTIIRGGRTVITAAIPALRAQARVAIQATFPHPLSPGVLPEGATATFEDGLHTVSLSVARAAVTDTVAALTANQPRDLTVAPATFDELFWQHYDGGT